MIYYEGLLGTAVAEELGLGGFQKHPEFCTVLLSESRKKLEAVETVGD